MCKSGNLIDAMLPKWLIARLLIILNVTANFTLVNYNYYIFEVIGSGTWVQTNSEQWSGPGAQAHNSNLFALFASSNLENQHQQPAWTQDTNSFLVARYWLQVLGLLHFNITYHNNKSSHQRYYSQ